nr:MAG TPA: hypothetical protein [Caudoviricetes sp.]DAS91540.1 MAG TPA: hypothetical protein [Caudoviricetes sp.]DAY39804.1 MAG TPA: hypothetical protein [Caudoviricetes sp.]
MNMLELINSISLTLKLLLLPMRSVSHDVGFANPLSVNREFIYTGQLSYYFDVLL